jgi:GTPase
MLEKEKKSLETVIIVGANLKRYPYKYFAETMEELAFLVESAGGSVKGALTQNIEKLTTHYIGKGKIAELVTLCDEIKPSLIVFNDELSPAQKRNLEKDLALKVVDRTELILDIFAERARSKVARLQVELAQLEYLYPRLSKMWSHLSRIQGGIGMRGPGETQLEVDRRLVKNKISKYKKDLEELKRSKQVQRKHRVDLKLPIVSLVGYTNAGKSSVMNRLSVNQVLEKDVLFATLDTTVNKVALDGEHRCLLIDTVGFIRKIPHHLVEAFHTTLDEIGESDILLHIVDVSKDNFQEDIIAVRDVLFELGATGKPELLVFNKIDLLHEQSMIDTLKKDYPQAIFVSANDKNFITEMKRHISQFLKTDLYIQDDFVIPYSENKRLATIKAAAVLEEESCDQTGTHLKGYFFDAVRH